MKQPQNLLENESLQNQKSKIKNRNVLPYEVNEPILNSPFDEPLMKLNQPFIELAYT
ncbi:MAG: hypothetical protein RLZZ339_1183 [Cyanobacteriota bacterium]